MEELEKRNKDIKALFGEVDAQTFNAMLQARQEGGRMLGALRWQRLFAREHCLLVRCLVTRRQHE